MDLFNNREVAIAIWGGALVVWILFAMPGSSAFGNLLKAFAQKQILTALGLMGIYICLVVFGLRMAGLWDIGQLKNAIVWSLSVAAVSLFRVSSIADDPNYYRNAIKDNLSLIVVLEFVIGFYTFNLWLELLIVPLAAILTAMLAVAEIKKEHAKAAHLLNNLLALLGLGLIAHALYRLVVDFQSVANIQTLTDLYLPPVLSLLFLPFLFVLALYVNYENGFVNLQFSLKNPALEAYARRRALLGFHVHSGLLKRWTRNLNFLKPQSRREIDDSIREVKMLRARERNPPDVPYERGWSPYLASAFLAPEGLHPGDYHQVAGGDNGWHAASPYLEVGKAVIPNTIAYYIEGGEFAATSLKLVINVNEPQAVEEARSKFAEAASALFEEALGDTVPEELRQRIDVKQPFTCEAHSKEVVLLKEPWPRHRFGGYELRFIVRNKSIVLAARRPY